MRPSYQGEFIRSVTNDNLNDEYYPPFKRKIKVMFSMAINLAIITLTIYLVVLIQNLKKSYLDKYGPDMIPISYINTAASIAVAIQIGILNFVY